MNITDDPMPGVAPNGTRNLWGIVVKGDKVEVATTYLKDLEFARRWAASVAHNYDEVVILDATLVHRVWDRDSERGKAQVAGKAA